LDPRLPAERAVIAALYVDRRGPYWGRDDVDAWDIERDARKYDGPHPVVAHPPCGPWSELRHLYKGDEHDCADFALRAVRRWGGVMEHPLRSTYWRRSGVVEPGDVDAAGGFTVDVEQVSWGHVARKPTRLYFVGVPRLLVMSTRLTGGTPTHWCSGTRNPDHAGGKVPPGIKVCSAQQRRRTPPAFADWLISLAEQARPTMTPQPGARRGE
jgi:hypothetical protein